MKDLIANQLVKYLEARGVEHIFGLCGHTNIAVLAALSKSKKIKFVNTRHEQIAAHAADGYARATKKASVVLSHLSPGLTNAATGVANAALRTTPHATLAESSTAKAKVPRRFIVPPEGRIVFSRLRSDSPARDVLA